MPENSMRFPRPFALPLIDKFLDRDSVAQFGYYTELKRLADKVDGDIGWLVRAPNNPRRPV